MSHNFCLKLSVFVPDFLGSQIISVRKLKNHRIRGTKTSTYRVKHSLRTYFITELNPMKPWYYWYKSTEVPILTLTSLTKSKSVIMRNGTSVVYHWTSRQRRLVQTLTKLNFPSLGCFTKKCWCTKQRSDLKAGNQKKKKTKNVKGLPWKRTLWFSRKFNASETKLSSQNIQNQ